MKSLLVVLFLLMYNSICFSQSTIEWTAEYKLQLSDFQSTTSEINNQLTTYAIYSGATMGFVFQMSTYQFMFTKNFNSKVSSLFNKAASSIIAPDTTTANQLLRVGQYNFDLTELYSRKFRKELYEQKGVFSDISYFKPIYEKLQVEMTNTSSAILKESELGENREVLEKAHQLVLAEIKLLSDFCKTCKPSKKKKERPKK